MKHKNREEEMNIKTSSTFDHSTGEEAQPTNAAPVTTTTTPFTNSNSTSNSSKTPYISTLSQKGDPQKIQLPPIHGPLPLSREEDIALIARRKNGPGPWGMRWGVT